MSSSDPLAPPFDLVLAPVAEALDLSRDAQQEVLCLFDEFAPRLRQYVRSCGLTPDVAEDVVQDAFLALFRHLRAGGSRDNLRGWLVRVSYRGALKHRERVQRRQRREGVWASDLERSASQTVDAEAALAGEQRRRRLKAVMRALPHRDRACVLLRAEGLTYREIARTLDVSLGTVAKSMAHALRRLSAIVGK